MLFSLSSLKVLLHQYPNGHEVRLFIKLIYFVASPPLSFSSHSLIPLAVFEFNGHPTLPQRGGNPAQSIREHGRGLRPVLPVRETLIQHVLLSMGVQGLLEVMVTSLGD